MTGSPGNGDHVTWRELNLALDPLKTEIATIGDDVKTLVTASSEERGRASAIKDLAARRYAALALFVAVAAIAVPVALGHG